MEICPCGSEQPYADCCDPLIKGLKPAPTAEALMRSRYTAYVKTEIDYIQETIHPKRRATFNRTEAAAWSKDSEWESLKIMETTDGGPEDQSGTVEFLAKFKEKGKLIEHHELAQFVKSDGQWFFMDASVPKPVQAIRQGPKIGRNAPCPCGSGKKYKKCCGG